MVLKFPSPVLLASSGMILLISFLSGCRGDGPRQDRESRFTIDISDDDLDDFSHVRQIFYSLPSPLEMAVLLKNSGAGYNEELLNPVENVSRYVTGRSMALNLGIYTTDLSYASLFDQTQTCMEYMDAAKRLADNLGIIDAIDDYSMERLEANLGNREVIMDIVSETFMNSSSFLQENNREPVAAMLLTGGWVEGLYLALNLVDENELEDNVLLDRIIDMRLSLEIVMLLLEDNSYNNDVAGLITEMEKIGEIFRQIDMQSTPIEVVQDPDDPVTLLRSSREIMVDSSIIRQLKTTVAAIRNSFVS